MEPQTTALLIKTYKKIEESQETKKHHKMILVVFWKNRKKANVFLKSF